MRPAITYIIRGLVACLTFALSASMLSKLSDADTAPQDCQIRDSSAIGVAIGFCRYHLLDSAVNNPNYYIIVDLTYSVSHPVTAVRFVFNIDGNMRYMVDRRQVNPGQTGSLEFQLISPAQSVTQLFCWADQAT